MIQRHGLGETLRRGLIALCLSLWGGAWPGMVAAADTPLPVVFDTDMDFDDTAALAYLAAAHQRGLIDLRGVTITGAGAGYPGLAIHHARCLLQRVGLQNVAVADSREPGVNAPSPALRLAVEIVLDTVFLGCLQPATPSSESAPALLARVLAETQGRAVLVATGPLDNVAKALALFDAVPGHGAALSQAYIMGGAIAVPGSLPFTNGYDGSQELNFWADPASAKSVLDRLRSAVSLIPLDATNDVPITAAYALRLLLDRHTPEARIVAAIANHPATLVGVLQKSAYWWDPLAAVAATQDNVVSYADGRVDVVQSGASAGRIVASDSGAPIRFAVAADKLRFEQLFIDVLNGR